MAVMVSPGRFRAALFYVAVIWLPFCLGLLSLAHRPRSWLLALAAATSALGLALLLRRLRLSRWPRWTMWLAAAGGIAGWGAAALFSLVVVAWVGVEEHLELGSPVCWEPQYFTKLESCGGRDHSFMQGRLAYELSEGVPGAAICRQFLQEPHEPAENDCEAPKRFEPRPCADFGIGGGFRCYACEHLAPTADRYANLYAFSSDCSKGIAFASINVELRDVPRRVEQARDRPKPWGLKLLGP